MLWRLHVPLVSTYFTNSSPILHPVTGSVPAWVVGSVDSVTSPLVLKGEACPEPWTLYLLSWSKHCFLSKELLTALSTSPMNREPRHWGYSLFNISRSSLLFSHNFDTASFLHFSDRELNELAANFKAWPNLVETGPSSSLRVRIM